jgi:hypothetical protein
MPGDIRVDEVDDADSPLRGDSAAMEPLLLNLSKIVKLSGAVGVPKLKTDAGAGSRASQRPVCVGPDSVRYLETVERRTGVRRSGMRSCSVAVKTLNSQVLRGFSWEVCNPQHGTLTVDVPGCSGKLHHGTVQKLLA